MIYARRRCRRNTRGASPTHKMATDDKALCGAGLMRKDEYWEEMPEPLDHEYCHLCWQIEEAKK